MTETASDPLRLSVVVPVASGAAHLNRLHDRLEDLQVELKRTGAPLDLCEVIYVNDDARDASADVLAAIASRSPLARVLTCSRNFGQHPATIAGIRESVGDWVVTMDEDGQHPPERIPDLFAAQAKGGLDLVYAQPLRGPHRSAFRDRSSRAVKAMMQKATGEPHLRLMNSFRLIRGDVARGAAQRAEHNTYFDINLFWLTTRVGTAPMELRDPRREAGEASTYRVGALLSHARRLFINSRVRALRLGVLVGALAVLVSTVMAAVFTLREFVAPDAVTVEGWPSTMVVILLLGGLSILLLGLLLEYVAVMVQTLAGRPIVFLIDRSGDERLRAHFGIADDGEG